MSGGATILVTRVGAAEGSRAAAAALACACSDPDRAALLIDLGEGRDPRPALIASAAARELEQRLAAHVPEARVAARGQICHLALPAGPDSIERLPAALALAREAAGVVHLPPGLLRPALAGERVEPSAAMLRADLDRDRALAALAVRDLVTEGLRVAVIKRPLAWVAARRALFGVLPAGAPGGLPPQALRICRPRSAQAVGPPTRVLLGEG